MLKNLLQGFSRPDLLSCGDKQGIEQDDQHTEQGAAEPVADASYLLAGEAGLWVWSFDTRQLELARIEDVARSFPQSRYRVISVNLLTGQMRLKAITSVSGPGSVSSMVRLTLASGQSVVTTSNCPVLTIDSDGHITTLPASEARIALVPRRMEMCYEVRANAAQFAGILNVCKVDPEAHADYEWLRPLAFAAWGWDRLEGFHRLGDEVLDELRADIERRARKLNPHKLQKMECYDCLVKATSNFASSIKLLFTLSILDRVFPVKVASREQLPGSGNVWAITIEDNENFLAAEGIYLGQPQSQDGS